LSLPQVLFFVFQLLIWYTCTLLMYNIFDVLTLCHIHIDKNVLVAFPVLTFLNFLLFTRYLFFLCSLLADDS
jgi:hypothetical protein